jgi:hypothetical protein
VNWRERAVCFNDTNSSFWVSYNLEKVKYAKNGCANCSVHNECIQSAYVEDDEPIGVIAGLSEYDRLLSKWKKVSDLNGNNWD